jgi:immune inhibitor A
MDDSSSYENKGIVNAERNVPNYGLKICVIGENDDRSVARILLHR